MNTLNMIPVSWLKERRVDPAPGDGVICSEFASKWSSVDDELYQRDPAHYDDWFITSFVDRLNTGKQPVGDDAVIEVLFDGSWRNNERPTSWSWEAKFADKDITAWKPDHEAMLADYKKTQEPKEDDTLQILYSELPVTKHPQYEITAPCNGEIPKPVFTQAMAEDGANPTTGMGCLILNNTLANATYERATIDFIGEWTCVYTSESCNERSCGVDNLLFKPIDTRTDREKAADKHWNSLKGADSPITLEVRVKTAFMAGVKWVGE